MTTTDWRARALCAGASEDEFDDEELDWRVIRRAKRICGACPVQGECLTFALEATPPPTWGVWGGFTSGERSRLRQGTSVKHCANCKTEYVYSVCPSCPRQDEQSLERKQIRVLLTEQTDNILNLISVGWSDRRIAEQMSVHFGRVISGASIKGWRAARSVPAGTPGGRYKPCTYDPVAVETVEVNRTGFGSLTIREQAALLRRWLNRDGSVTGFSRTYRCSGSKVRALQAKLLEIPND